MFQTLFTKVPYSSSCIKLVNCFLSGIQLLQVKLKDTGRQPLFLLLLSAEAELLLSVYNT